MRIADWIPPPWSRRSRREYRAVLRLSLAAPKSPSFVLKAMQNRTRDELEEDDDPDLDEDEPELDETDPFYFSEGMHL